MHLLSSAAQEGWLWLTGSFLVALLWTNLSWLFAPWVEDDESAETSTSLAKTIVRRVGGGRFSSPVYQILRLLYYVGIPAAALFWGRDAVVGRFLGLQPLLLPDSGSGSPGVDVAANWSAWLHDLGWAAGIAIASIGLLALASLTVRKALSSLKTVEGSHRRPSASVAVREALYHEIHWAFYRNAPIVTFGAYWGTWAGLLLVGLQAAANPRWRERLRDPGAAWSELRRAAIAVVSAVLFLRTQNLWLAFLVHAALSWTVAALYEAPTPENASPVSRSEALASD